MANNFDKIIDYKKSVEAEVNQWNKDDYQCIMKFTGSYEGELPDEKRNEEIDNLLQSLQAKQVDSIESAGYYAVYAYTGLVDDYIKANGKRININIAFTYDEEEDKTEVYLATPIINEEF